MEILKLLMIFLFMISIFWLGMFYITWIFIHILIHAYNELSFILEHILST